MAIIEVFLYNTLERKALIVTPCTENISCAAVEQLGQETLKSSEATQFLRINKPRLLSHPPLDLIAVIVSRKLLAKTTNMPSQTSSYDTPSLLFSLSLSYSTPVGLRRVSLFSPGKRKKNQDAWDFTSPGAGCIWDQSSWRPRRRMLDGIKNKSNKQGRR